MSGPAADLHAGQLCNMCNTAGCTCMEEAVCEQLLQVRLHRSLRKQRSVNAQAVNFVSFVDLDAGHILHGEHTLRGERPNDLRHLDPGCLCKVGAEAICILTLKDVVDFLGACPVISMTLSSVECSRACLG